MVEILSPGERIEHTLESFPDQELVREAKSFVHFYSQDILNQLKAKLVRG